MSDETNESQTMRHKIGWVLALLLLLLLIMGATALWPGNSARLIKPFVPTRTAVPVTYDAQFEPVSFPDLQANPEQYRDQQIRVTGRYTRLTPPNCVSFDGPIIRWGLIAEDLQMNAQGLESLLHLIPADTTLTVEGVWRRYRGPVGCGKELETASVWYLVVSRIVQPNPLPLPGMPPVNGSASGTGPTASAVSNEHSEPTPTVDGETAVTLTPPTATPTQLPTNTPPGFPTTSPVDGTPTLLPTSQPIASATPVSGSQPTATAATATVAPTATVTSTPNPNATATPGNGSQPPIGIPTATPGESTAYPNPTTPPSYP